MAAVAYVVVVFGLLFVAPLTVLALKRQWLFFAAGWVTLGMVWWIAAFRLGRPASWWARRFYDEEKLARARERYP